MRTYQLQTYQQMRMHMAHRQGLWLQALAENEEFRKEYKRELEIHENYLNEIVDNIMADLDGFKKHLAVVCTASKNKASFWKPQPIKTVLHEHPPTLIKTISDAIKTEDAAHLKRGLILMIRNNFCNRVQKFRENMTVLAKGEILIKGHTDYRLNDMLVPILDKLLIKLQNYALIELKSIPTYTNAGSSYNK